MIVAGGKIPALIMVPPAGDRPSERWMAQGRRSAALDLVAKLSALDGVAEIYGLAAHREDQEALQAAGAVVIPPQRPPFHFGQAISQVAIERSMFRLAYFGAASSPLLPARTLEEALEKVMEAREPMAIVNNFHSTDWVVMNHAAALGDHAARLPTDNSLGWVLEREAGFRVQALPPSAASRSDIDTPTDLLLLHGHPSLGSYLRAFLDQVPSKSLQRLDALRKVLKTPAKTLSIIGRSSGEVWKELQRRTQIWIRMFVEERGMVASGRLAQGKVVSLIGQMLEIMGAGEFVERLASISDAILWDTRVWMAHRGGWPPASDRFASDLGWVEQVQNSQLRELTQAVLAADCPIITGGQGVVSGGVYALLETLESS